MSLLSAHKRSAARICRLAALFVAAGALLVAAAAGASTPTTRDGLPPPDPAASARVQQNDYRIGPLDVLEITVFQVDQLNRTVQVNAAGVISLPLIGDVAAAAETPRQLESELEAKYNARYLQSAQVTVFVKTAQSQKFTVEGAVTHPGVFEISGRMTLLQAVATAQGLETNADEHHVVIYRVVDNARRAAIVDLNAVRDGRIEDPAIYPSDVIVVTYSQARRVLRDVLNITPLAVLFHFW